MSTEATVDLSGLEAAQYSRERGRWELTGKDGLPFEVDGHRNGPYFVALEDLLLVLVYRNEELPDRLYTVITKELHAKLWSRNGGDGEDVKCAARRSLPENQEPSHG